MSLAKVRLANSNFGFRPNELEMFNSRVLETEGCHLWIGALKGNGYGTLDLGGVRYFAHRLAWKIKHGYVPIDKDVLHKCNIRRCVSIEHLKLGDNKENMQDKVNSNTQPKALNEEEKSIAYMLYFGGGYTERSLALHMGVSRATIRRAIHPNGNI